MQNQKDNNQIHRIYKEKLCENKMNRNQFLENLKQLPQLKQFNNLKCFNLSDTQTKYNLGLLHIYQLINIFQLVDQNQCSEAPLDLAMMENFKLSQSERIRLVIQQLIEAQNLQSKGIIEANSPFVIIHHRQISEAIIKLSPQIFQVGIILFEDQNLTETLRAIYDLSGMDYQNLLKLISFDKKCTQKQGMDIQNQDYNFQIQNASEVDTDKKEIFQMAFDNDYQLFEIKLENRKQIYQKLCEIPVDQHILYEKFDQTENYNNQTNLSFSTQNYQYIIPLQFNQSPDQHESKNSNEEEDFLTKQRNRIYNLIMKKQQENGQKRRTSNRINWAFGQKIHKIKTDRQKRSIQKIQNKKTMK